MFNVSTNVVWVAPVASDTRVRVSDSTQTNISPIFTPDGKSLLFVSSVGGIRDVYQQAVDGDGRPIGARRRLTTGLSAFAISLSADGTRMAYDVVRNFANIWMVPIKPDAPSTFADALQVTRDNQQIEAVDVSHDGKWIVFDTDRSGNFDIYKLRLDGGDPVQLTTSPNNEFHPLWSPDDAQISFHSQRSGIRHIYVMGADGGVESQATNGLSHDYNRAWSSDGRSLSFATLDDQGYRWQVVTRAANGKWSAPHPIGSGSDHDGVGTSSWSPDGSAIVFTKDGNLLVAPAPGGVARTLATAGALGGGPMELAWRDLSTIVVSTRRANGTIAAIMAVSPLSGAVRTLITADATHIFGRLSTDGKRLFFTLAAWESDVGIMELVKNP
jgi:Tol biopolymer transport system component